jgi:hypothetical protein
VETSCQIQTVSVYRSKSVPRALLLVLVFFVCQVASLSILASTGGANCNDNKCSGFSITIFKHNLN